jgi:hypothetical protein
MRATVTSNRSFSVVRHVRAIFNLLIESFDSPERQQFRRLKKMVG